MEPVAETAVAETVMAWEIWIRAVIPLASSALGAAVGVFLGIHLSSRPRRVVSLVENTWVAEGWNSEFDWLVTDKPVPVHFEKVHQAAWTRFGKEKSLPYDQILNWVKKGAPGPDGKRTINRSSTKNEEAASRAAQALTGFVFQRGEIKKH